MKSVCVLLVVLILGLVGCQKNMEVIPKPALTETDRLAYDLIQLSKENPNVQRITYNRDYDVMLERAFGR